MSSNASIDTLTITVQDFSLLILLYNLEPVECVRSHPSFTGSREFLTHVLNDSCMVVRGEAKTQSLVSGFISTSVDDS